VCLRSAVTATNKLRFGSSGWYRFPAKFQLVEPTLKIVLPLIALSMELFFDHLNEKSPYQRLYCPEGTAHAGEFAGDNVNNWQHASSYPAVIVSGIVDFVSVFIELPSGVNRAFSALWIGVMSFLMFVHEKHEALDRMVHWLLAMSMLFAFLFQAMEIYAQHSPVISMGKAASTIFVGAWLVQIGRMMYGGAPQWSTSRGIAAMMAPIFFCMIFLLICSSVLLCYVVLATLQRKNMVPKRLLATVLDKEEDGDTLPRTVRHRIGKEKHADSHENALHFEMGGLLMSERSFDGDSANGVPH